MKKFFTLLSLILFLASAGNTASRYYVSGVSGSDESDGTSWADAFATIKTAVDAAALEGTSVEVWVEKGTYDITSQIVIRENVNVYGGFAFGDSDFSQRNEDPSLTIIDAGQTGRVLNQADVFSSLTVWNGFTIQNGLVSSSTSAGAAGVNLKTNGRIENCIIKNNKSNANGAGVYLSGGYLFNCTITGNEIDLMGTTNSSNYGGGVYITEKGTVENCIISNNSINSAIASTNSRGGGICANKGGQIINCEFEGNSAYNGGALWVAADATGESPNIENCIFTENSAANQGGAAYATINSGSTGYHSSFINCVFANNTSVNQGGGIYCSANSSAAFGNKVINCTIVKNKTTSATSSNAEGGGIYSNHANVIMNCLIWGNQADGTTSKKQIRQNSNQYAACINCAIQNLTNTTSDFGGSSTTAIREGLFLLTANNDNVQFIDEPGGDYRIKKTSTCLNAGVVAYGSVTAPTTDLLNSARPATPSIGAYEAYVKLSLTQGDNGTITGAETGDSYHLLNSSISLVATPNSGYQFATWIIDGSNSASAPTVMDDDKTVTATFELSTGLESVVKDKGEITSVKYYTVTGIEVQNPHNGIFIQKATYADGSVETIKVMK